MPMPDTLVCPECGNDEFTRDAPAMLRLVGNVYAGIGFEDGGLATAEPLDIERDYDELRCNDCGATHDPDDLVTEDAYNRDDECDECGADLEPEGHCLDCRLLDHYESEGSS